MQNLQKSLDLAWCYRYRFCKNAVQIQKDYKLSDLSKIIASLGQQRRSYNQQDQNYNNKQYTMKFEQGHQYELIYDSKNMENNFVYNTQLAFKCLKRLKCLW
ncbi:hypothetical protein pb186bvf_015266 [Paramecium bursaria]